MNGWHGTTCTGFEHGQLGTAGLTWWDGPVFDRVVVALFRAINELSVAADHHATDHLSRQAG